MNSLEETLYTIFLRSPNNLFDEFIAECQKFYEIPAHSFSEMRSRDNKKIRGDIFEEFCVLYLKHIKGFVDVWLLKDVPHDILEKLTMKRQDMGIDIVARTHDQKYIAVQCKYKKHTSFKQNILSWKSLSTFYALCLRTGPWEKYIIMTNCIYTRHQGKKTPNDISYCLKTLQNITKDEWLQMCGKTGVTTGMVNDNIVDISVNDEKEKEETIELPIKPKTKVIKKKVTKKKTETIIPSKEELRQLRNNFLNIAKSI